MDHAVTVDRPTLTRCTGSTPWLRAHRRNDRGLMPMKLAASVVVRVVRTALLAQPAGIDKRFEPSRPSEVTGRILLGQVGPFGELILVGAPHRSDTHRAEPRLEHVLVLPIYRDRGSLTGPRQSRPILEHVREVVRDRFIRRLVPWRGHHATSA